MQDENNPVNQLFISRFLYYVGEVSWDISGMFSIDDYSEFNKRTVLEHDMRGFTIKDFDGRENLKVEDLKWYQLPTDEEFEKFKLKGIYLGNFVKWDPYKQTDLMKELYGWKESLLILNEPTEEFLI